jgi:hypothetical protein
MSVDGVSRVRRIVRVAAPIVVAMMAVGAMAGPAWAPSTSDIRSIKITANTAAGAPVKELDVDLQVFMTADGIENRLSESGPSDTGDRSVTAVILRDAAGAPIAVFSAGLIAQSRPRDGYVSETTVDSSLDPPSTGRARQIAGPDVRWRRLVHGVVRDAAGNVAVVDDVFLDLRFRAVAPGLVVAQTVDIQTDDTLSISYALGGDVNGDGIPDVIVASGTASAHTNLTALNTYTGLTDVRDSAA